MVQTTSHIFSGKVDIESNLLVGSSHLFVDTTNNRVGITTADPDASLHVNGNAYVESNVGVGSNIKLDGDTGIITATGFVGDASNLTGISSNLQEITDSGNVTSNTIQFINTGTSLTASGNVVIDGNVTSTTALISNVATIGTTKTFVVTVQQVNGVNKYHIDGVDRPLLELHEHQTYIFDFSSSTLLGNGGHPFIFSETANGGAYTSGITTTGNYGSDQIRTFVVPTGAPTTLYYYCTYHNGMGATVSISPTAELIVSGRVVASGNVEASTFIGDGSQLTGVVTSISLQDATDAGNTTSNTTQFTNTGTSLTASGSIMVSGGVNAAYLTGDGSNVNIGQMAAETVPYVDSNKQLRDSHITRTANKTIITSNLEVIGNVITQNNITVGAQGSYYGDGTTLTGVALSTDLSDNVIRIGNLETDLSDNVIRIGNLETATIISNSSTITTGFTKGDIIYASDDNVLNKLAVGGTDGHVLKVTNAANKTLGWGVETNQWNTVNTNEIHYSGGNVGINVSDPAFKLDVHGTANVGALTATSLSVGGQALALEADLTANASRVDAIYSGSVGDIIYVDATNSLAKRSIGAQGDVLKVSAGGIPVWDGEPDVSSQWSNVTVDEVYFDGNVGISNTNPGHDLSVGSNLFVDDDGSNVLVISGNAAMTALTLGEVSIVASHGLGDILNESNTSPNTMELTNATTGLVATGNVHALKFIGDGSELTNIASNLDQIVNNGNVTSNTIQFTNATMGLVATGNVHALKFIGDGSELTNLASNLEEIVNNGNVTSNTIQFTNATTSLVASGNVEVGGELTMSGTGALTVPNGTTDQRPTAANGMIRYNSTTGFMEAYTASGWAPIAQPPTVTGISPLSTLASGGIAQGWNTGTKIQASDKAANDYYGCGVAMNSDGTMMIVGSGYADPNGVSGAGAAYIYTYSGGSWGSEVKIVASDKQVDDSFGCSVSMSGDGTRVIVGSQYEDAGGTSSGAAYIFTYSGGSWDAGVKIVASDATAHVNFGENVSMSSDGTKVIVGRYGDDGHRGAVYIFTYSGSSWDAGTKIMASDKAASDQLGGSVAISGDGTTVIASASGEDAAATDAGAVYLYTYSGGSWGSEVKFVAPDGQAGDRLGDNGVSINSDGTKFIAGAQYEDGDAGGSDVGAAYIFTYSGGSWDTGTKIVAPDAEASDHFGNGVYMSSDGTKVIVGADLEDTGGTDAGAAYIFTYSGGSWDAGVKIVAPDAEAGDNFGGGYFGGVSMSGDGTKVVVAAMQEDTGATGAGAAYVFDYRATALFDTSTQVFTATGTGIVSGSTVQLEGANGSLYNVVDATPPNAAGTQVTFKMGSVGSGGVEFPPSAMSTNTSITGYVASASYNSSTAWKAFDDTTNYWETTTNSATHGYYQNTIPLLAGIHSATTQDISGTTHRGHWLQLQIPNPVVLSRAVIGAGGTGAAYQIGQFVILGSNDNINWTALHAGDNTSAASASAPYSLSLNVTTLSAGSTEAFSYFRVVIKSKGTPYNFDIQLQNIQFFSGSGSWDLANQPYKVRINSTSGLIGASTAVIGFLPTWTTAAEANLSFDTTTSMSHTLVGTDGGGGTNRKFTVVSTGVNALPSPLTLTEAGIISGQIAANQDGVTTSVTVRLTDNTTGLFTDRAINIVGFSALYPFTSHTFTNAGKTGRFGPALSEARDAYGASGWWQTIANFDVGGPDDGAGAQEWTVPADATYTIKAAGAGNYNLAGGTKSGDAFKGIEIQGTFTLTKGDTVRIVVGQSGSGGSGYTGGSTGGAGGTYVFYNRTDTYPIIVAGGAGGWNGNSPYYQNGFTLTDYATCGQSGTSGGQNSAGQAGGSGGNGATNTGSYAGGGAGWLTNGGDAPSNAGSGGHTPRQTGYNSYSLGGAANDTGYGGYGGGGGVHGNTGGGGGGGGYSGGIAVDQQNNGRAGGGGSYGGTATGVYNEGQGYVVITRN